RELLLAHMMRNEARDHAIETASRQTDVVAREICNRLQTGLGLGDHFAAGIEIDAGQMRLDTALLRPSVDLAQHVAVAEADIEQAEAAAFAHCAAQEGKRRPVSEGEAVYACQIAEHGLVSARVERRIVHQFGGAEAL